MKRFVTGLFATPLLAGMLMAAPSTAEAQEIQLTGPLKGAPACKDCRLYREGRLEVAPAVSFTLLDEYRRTILVGGRLTYNIKDWLGIGVWGGAGAISITTNLTDQIDQVAPRDNRTAANVAPGVPGRAGNQPTFADQTAKISYVVAPQVTFVPFRGKLAIFQKVFIDTDFYAAAGVAFVGLQERTQCGANGQPACTQAKSFALDSRTAVAPTFGIGFSFNPIGSFINLGVEYRALPFSWNRAGFDTQGGPPNGKFPDGKVDGQDSTFKWNQMITLAVGFSFDVGNGFSTKIRTSE